MNNNDKREPISLSNLSGSGYIVSPNPILACISGVDASVPERNIMPCLIAKIPNLEEFSEGPDIVGNGLIIKPEGQLDAYVPLELKPFLAVIQMALDNDVLTLGAAEARKRWVLVRASRHTCDENDKAHQRHVVGWHNYAALGPSAFYLASDVFPTEFRDWKAPAASIIRLDQSHIHRSPMIGRNRRTFLVVASFTKEPDVRLAFDCHPMTKSLSGMMRAEKSGVIESWRAAATAALREQYPRQHYDEDLKGWLRGQLTLSL